MNDPDNKLEVDDESYVGGGSGKRRLSVETGKRSLAAESLCSWCEQTTHSQGKSPTKCPCSGTESEARVKRQKVAWRPVEGNKFEKLMATLDDGSNLCSSSTSSSSSSYDIHEEDEEAELRGECWFQNTRRQHKLEGLKNYFDEFRQQQLSRREDAFNCCGQSGVVAEGDKFAAFCDSLVEFSIENYDYVIGAQRNNSNETN